MIAGSNNTSNRRKGGIGLSYVFFSTYFIFNLIAILVYPACRVLGLKQNSKNMSSQIIIGDDREMSILTLFGVYMLIKARKCSTWELFIN